MDYKYLSYCSKEELKNLKSIVENSSVKDEKLLIDIDQMLEKQKILDYDFSSDNIPHYQKELEKKCNIIFNQLDFSKLFFFMTSFCEKGNGDDFSNPNVTCDLKKYYGQYVPMFRLLVEQPLFSRPKQSMCEGYIYLSQIDNMFKKNYYKEHYEGSYNILNYIKNYIYLMLSIDETANLDTIFQDYSAKKLLVENNLSNISSYLIKIRENTNLRSSLSNYGLSRNARKKCEKLTPSQEVLIDALAFGTTIDKIENKDYSDFQKILYLPRGKELKR